MMLLVTVQVFAHTKRALESISPRTDTHGGVYATPGIGSKLIIIANDASKNIIICSE